MGSPLPAGTIHEGPVMSNWFSSPCHCSVCGFKRISGRSGLPGHQCPGLHGTSPGLNLKGEPRRETGNLEQPRTGNRAVIKDELSS